MEYEQNVEHLCLVERSAYDALKAENERLKEAISYLPKIPTEPYEREMAREIERLKAQSAVLREALEWYASWDWSDKYVQPVPKRAREALAKADEVGEK